MGCLNVFFGGCFFFVVCSAKPYLDKRHSFLNNMNIFSLSLQRNDSDDQQECRLFVEIYLEPSSSYCQPWFLSWMHIGLVIRRLQVRSPPGPEHSLWRLIMVYFLQSLIQEGQLSVTGELAQVLVSHLED